MAGDKEHIRIKKESLNNPRRSGRPPRFIKRDNLEEHGQKLAPFLAAASAAVKNQNASKAGRYTLKLKYEGTLTFKNLIAHNIIFN